MQTCAVTRGILALFLVGVGACNGGDVVCAANAINAIAITVVDSATGGTPSSPPTIIAVNNGKPDTATAGFANNVYWVGFGQSGIFDLSVIASGYRTWVNTITVPAYNTCGDVHTANVTARLQH